MIKRFLIIILVGLALGGCMPNIGVGPGGSANKKEFTKGGVGANFPALPFYPEAKVLEGYSSVSGYGASAITSDSLEKVVEFYRKNLGLAGWEFNLVHKETARYVFEVKNSQHQGTVIVNTAADGKKTGITISLTNR